MEVVTLSILILSAIVILTKHCRVSLPSVIVLIVVMLIIVMFRVVIRSFITQGVIMMSLRCNYITMTPCVMLLIVMLRVVIRCHYAGCHYDVITLVIITQMPLF
jgi:hypothetical protein